MQVIFGECELSVGDEPTEHVEIDEPAAVAPSVEAAQEPAPVVVPSVAEEPAPAPVAAAAEPAFSGVVEALAAASAVEAEATESAKDSLASDGSLDAELAELGIVESEEAAPELSVKSAEHVRSGRKRRRRTDDEVGDHSGWSQPPSQPPPAG
jgi:hypothetical protein